MLTFAQVVEVDLVDPVHHLAYQLAGFHVVVGILENGLDDAAAISARPCGVKSFQSREQAVVDEGEQFFAGNSLGIGRPSPPLKFSWDRRRVIILHQFQFLVLIVDDFEKEHPAELADALGIPIDTGVFAHDVLYGFNYVADGHGSGNLPIESGLEFVDGSLEILESPKSLYKFNGCAEFGEGRNA